MKINKNKIATVVIALIFISSIFVVFARGVSETKKAKIIINIAGENYGGEMAIKENETLIEAISSISNDIKLENGNIKCIANYCNNQNFEWRVYKVGETLIRITNVDKEIVHPNEEYLIEYSNLRES